MTENEVKRGGWYRHVGEDVKVLSTHSGQAYVKSKEGNLFYVPYSELKSKPEKAA